MKAILVLVLWIVSLTAIAQETMVSGKISGGSGDVDLIVDRWHLMEQAEMYTMAVKDGAFSQKIKLDRNRIVYLMYDGEQIKVYLEPGDQLKISLTKGDNGLVAMFSGKGGIHNNFLWDMRMKHGDDFDPDIMEQRIKAENIDEFEIGLFGRQKAHKTFIENYPENDFFSSGFKTYLSNKIRYNYLANLMAFPIIRGNADPEEPKVRPLPGLMLDVIDKKSINNDEVLISAHYRSYLYYYVTYFTSVEMDYVKFTDFNPSMERKMAFAKTQLKGQHYHYVTTKYLMDNAEKMLPSTIRKVHQAMVDNDATGMYAKIIESQWAEKMKQKDPKKPKVAKAESKDDKGDGKPRKGYSFELRDMDGKKVSLDDYKGKVVYMDFWASWCGPCRRQFPFAKTLKEKFSKKQLKEIVFLYINIDNTEAAWKKAVEQFGIEGTHTFAPGAWGSEATKFFKVSSIPRYILMDKNGKIVQLNGKRPSDATILDDIIYLLE